MAKFTRQGRRNENMIAGMYDLEERLGSGHFAEVKLARHVFTGERVAVKVIDKLKLDETAKLHLYQEVRCMKLVQHPNIVRLYEVIDTTTKLYLVQELGDGGDMYDYIMKHEDGLSEEKARRYFRQILQAIDYCHRLFVVHRDLKPENVIFFKKHDVAKLTDFGFSNKFMPGTKLQTSCGSLAYSAPEILLGDSYDAPAVDVWSLGVILYMMVVGKAPFCKANESETLTMILDCKFHIPDHVSPVCQSLISRMIVRDACKRATLDNIMDDLWVQGDHGPVAVTSVPLSTQVKIGLDHHNEIVEKMQLGNIADHETIKQCLDSGSYNHISATYYLLAEQILRRWHQTNAPSIASSVSANEVESHVKRKCLPPPRMGSFQVDDEQSLDGPLVAGLPLGGGSESDTCKDIGLNLLTSKICYHSSESIYDDIKKSDCSQNEIVGAVSVAVTTQKGQTFQKKRVVKVKSTPAFLNQISEERESDLDDSPRASPRVRRSSRRPLNVIHKTQRPSPASSTASSTGGRRSSSHSSSSEDDGDLDKKMRRLSTERCRRSPKRRSDDEGEGDDGSGGGGGLNGVARKKLMSEKPSQQSSCKEASSKSGNGSNERGKSSRLHSETLPDKLLDIYVKLDEEEPLNSATALIQTSYCETRVSGNSCGNISQLPDISSNPVSLSNSGAANQTTGVLEGYSCNANQFSEEVTENASNSKPYYMVGEEFVDKVVTRSEYVLNSENIVDSSKDIASNSSIEKKSDECITSEDNVKSENMFVDFKKPVIFSKNCSLHSQNSTCCFENMQTISQNVKFDRKSVHDNSGENLEEIDSSIGVNNEHEKHWGDLDASEDINASSVKCECLKVDRNEQNVKDFDTFLDLTNENEKFSGVLDKNLKDLSGKCEDFQSDVHQNSDAVMTLNDDNYHHIMEIFKERSLTNETLENISDKENMEFTLDNDGKNFSNVDNARCMRGSDIEDIEMLVKSKPVDPVTVRTIYNHPKVSRVTSSCCKIV